MSSSSLPAARAAAPSHAPSQRGFALLLLAGVLWGTGGPAGHLLQAQGVAPMAVATYRLLLAGLLISAFLLVSGELRRIPVSRPLVRRLAVNGVLHAVFQMLYFGSLALIPVGLATLVKIGSVPVFVAVGVCALSRTRPGARLAVPVLLAVAGLVLLAGFPGTGGSPARLAGGLACALGAGLAFSAMTLLNRKPVEGLPPLVNTGLGMLAGAVLLLPAGAAAGLAVPVRADSLALLAFLGTVPTVLAYLAYFAGLRTASDTGAAVGTLAEPLTAALLSVAFLGEVMTPLGAAGAVLLLASMGAEPLSRAIGGRLRR